jgi:hypothetical protein
LYIAYLFTFVLDNVLVINKERNLPSMIWTRFHNLYFCVQPKVGDSDLPKVRGLYFGPKTIFIPPPPPSETIFFPLARHVVFRLSYHDHFALIFPYFAFTFSFPFLSFSLTCSPFSSPSHNFSPNDIGCYPSREGGG